MKILMAGGMTGGPVTPLFALAEEIRHQYPHTRFLLVDDYHSVGHNLAIKNKIPFDKIHSGKLKRYWAVSNLLAPFLTIIGLFEAFVLIRKFKPDIAIGAGGYMQVPVLWTAWLNRIPVLIHQQDILPGLANLLCAPIAKKITVTFPVSASSFSEGITPFLKKKESKIIVAGNPVRDLAKTASKAEAITFYKLDKNFPTVLIFGGGSGAMAINDLVFKALPELCKYVQIIHSTGSRKNNHDYKDENYHGFEFIERMDLAYKAADIVVSRAGVSTIAELSELGKVSVIIPMPNTHQEHNAEYVWNRGAALILDQAKLDHQQFIALIRKLILDGPSQKQLSVQMSELLPKHSSKKIAKIIVDLIEKS